MIDIHTHILFGIDDGAKNADEAIRMLRAQLAAGVSRIYLTPHFNCEIVPAQEFLENRQIAYDKLIEAANGEKIPELRLGAEIKYSPSLLGLPIERFALSGSYILLELPFYHYPAHIDKVIKELDASGITVILAHVERYAFFRRDPYLLFSLIEAGAMGQINIKSLTDKADKGFAKACLNNSLAHFAASDAHNITDRPPCMDELPDLVSRDIYMRLEKNAQILWDDEPPCFYQAGRVKKTFFGYW